MRPRYRLSTRLLKLLYEHSLKLPDGINLFLSLFSSLSSLGSTTHTHKDPSKVRLVYFLPAWLCCSLWCIEVSDESMAWNLASATQRHDQSSQMLGNTIN